MIRSRRRRALLLIEFLFVLLPSVIVFGLMMFLIVDFITIQRLAGEHASRMTVVDSLSAKLRDDIASSRNVGCVVSEDGTAVLSLSSIDNESIIYRFDPERVSRSVSEVADNIWSAPRLGFACAMRSGAAGRLLQLSLEELPPPPNSALPPRRFVMTFVLPAAQAPGAGVDR